MRPTALLAILIACGAPAEDTGPVPRPAMSREVFVRHFGPAWCAAMAECLPDLDAAAACANDRSAAVDEFCTDYDPAAGAACIEALEDLGADALCSEVYPESVAEACGDACGW